MNCFFVMAKLDEHDREFSGELVGEKYPANYALIPGHVWVVATNESSSHDVAKTLGLVVGGNTEASGVVVPASGYWGFAHNDLWRFLQREEAVGNESQKGLLHALRRQ